jgi:hypothetical protein
MIANLVTLQKKLKFYYYYYDYWKTLQVRVYEHLGRLDGINLSFPSGDNILYTPLG